MYKRELRLVSENLYEIEKKGSMNVPGRIYANDNILRSIDINVLSQIENVASLPGIISYSLAMPDAHWGYGFPIGGVAAFPFPDGIISPGGIGYDINCGVRLMKTGITYREVQKKIRPLTDKLFQNIPLGLGQGAIYRPDKAELSKILSRGAQYIVEKGFGDKEDLQRCDSNGCIPEADAEAVSDRAKERGLGQLGSLGAGNHFIEIDVVEEIFDEHFTREAGIFKGELFLMIHSGSRGLGHQITTDWISILMKEIRKKDIFLRDRQLVYTEANTEAGKRYFSAMNAGANFAFANRQLMSHKIRTMFTQYLSNQARVELICDCCHNIAMKESINGKNIIVHRKGATRADPKEKTIYGNKSFSSPVIVPGSMGSGFHLLSPEEKCADTFFSLPHGAGRLLGRKQACRKFKENDIKKELMNKGIYVKNYSSEGVSEEAPGAYKGLEDVVETVTKVGLARSILRGRPVGNIKG
ncbi:RtcB family protein [candidate division WOR-3 bacterium]|nr:RtcB family protein [candidate division WOR-3 bacterium]